MIPTDIRKLYTLAAALDDRLSLRDPTELALRLEAWNIALGPLPVTLDQAKTALAAHYRASTDRIMPAHIAEHIAATTPAQPSQPGVIHTQLPPCDHCGLQPSHHAHTEHPYQSADAPEPITTGTPAIDWNKELRR